jgi:hypothetical protein
MNFNPQSEAYHWSSVAQIFVSSNAVIKGDRKTYQVMMKFAIKSLEYVASLLTKYIKKKAQALANLTTGRYILHMKVLMKCCCT